MIRKTAAVSAAAALILGAAAAPAEAARPRTTELVLSYTADAGVAAAVRLWCDPAGGAHPFPAKACATLKEADARPGRIKPSRLYCTLIYAPVTAEVRGVWKGRRVHWSKEFGNVCEMTRATGILFQF